MDHIFLKTKIFFFQENLSLEENTDEINDERKKRKDETGIILLLYIFFYFRLKFTRKIFSDTNFGI